MPDEENIHSPARSPSKRSRSSEPPEPEGESQLSTTSVDEEFRCAICLDILTVPYTIIPCLHTFDKECLTAWWKANGNCPTCKKRSTLAKSAFQLKSIMDHVHKKRRKVSSLSENNNGEIYPLNGEPPIEDDDDDDGSGYDDDGDNDVEYSPGENLVWPCAACPPNNISGYTCTVPIPEPTNQERQIETQRRGANATAVGPPLRGEFRTSLNGSVASNISGVAEHAQCVGCSTYIPRDFPRPVKCGSCSRYFCQRFDPVGCPNTTLMAAFYARSGNVYSVYLIVFSLEPRLIEEIKLYNHTVQVLVGDYLPPNLRNNRHEVSRLVDYLNARALSVDTVLAQLFDMKHAQIAEDLNDREADENWGPNAHFCSSCVSIVVSNMLFPWWCLERRRSLDNGEGVIVLKPDCWYGIECRTQTHNDSHGERYNHVCLNARASTT